MLKYMKNEDGNALVELVMVATLLLLFGFTVFTLIITGADTQERITQHKNDQIDARIADSYLNVRIRQNDIENSMRVEKNPYSDETALVLTYSFTARNNEKITYDTWIFHYDNKLYECIVYEGEEVDYMLGNFIADISSFNTVLKEDSNTITNTITYDYGEDEKMISQTLFLRTKQ